MENTDGSFRMGITDNAQEQLGDMVFVELPSVGDEINTGDAIAVVESVKAASDVYSPADLEIIGVNESLEDEPELLNSSCFDDGYLFDFRTDNIEGLLDASEYQAIIDSED